MLNTRGIILGFIALLALCGAAVSQPFGYVVGPSGGCVLVTGSGGCVGQTSPTLITPALGVATGTSVALGGATIGTNALAVTGTSQFSNGSGAAPSINFASSATTGMSYAGSSNLVFSLGGVSTALIMDSSGGNPYISGNAGGQVVGFQSNGDLKLQPHAGNILYLGIGTEQFGQADVDTAPVAQTLRSQGALASGTSNVAGANWTFIASPGKGTGAGGSFIFQTTPAGSSGTVVGTPTTALSLDSAQKATFGGQIVAASMTQTSAAQSGTVCWAAAGLTYDASLGCLASLEELKNIRPGGMPEALDDILKLKPFWFNWKSTTPEWKGGNHEVLPGLGAHATEAVDKRLVGYGPDGKLRGVHYPEMVALLVAGMQQQQKQIDGLTRRVAVLEKRAK